MLHCAQHETLLCDVILPFLLSALLASHATSPVHPNAPFFGLRLFVQLTTRLLPRRVRREFTPEPPPFTPEPPPFTTEPPSFTPEPPASVDTSTDASGDLPSLLQLLHQRSPSDAALALDVVIESYVRTAFDAGVSATALAVRAEWTLECSRNDHELHQLRARLKLRWSTLELVAPRECPQVYTYMDI